MQIYKPLIKLGGFFYLKIQPNLVSLKFSTESKPIADNSTKFEPVGGKVTGGTTITKGGRLFQLQISRFDSNNF